MDTIDGPDLGLIILAEHDARKVQASDGFVFYDLPQRLNEMQDGPPFSESLQSAVVLGVMERMGTEVINSAYCLRPLFSFSRPFFGGPRGFAGPDSVL